jgi:hypothetical protein
LEGTAIGPVEKHPRVGLGPRWRRALVVALVCAAALWGYRLGQNRSPLRWHTGNAYSVDAQITVEADGKAYAIPIDGYWNSADGLLHDHGRPDCLPPTGEIKNVRFAEVPVKVAGTGWGEVVFVDC